MQDLAEILQRVPAHDRFLSSQEVHGAFDDIVEEFPGIARSEAVGCSAEGRPIQLLSVGHGTTPVLVVGVPHPNEPIGILTSLFLARLLCEDECLSRRLDVTLHIVPVADPDGLALNEEWLGKPMSFRSYAKGFYRPPHHEQVEWSYPVLHRTLRFPRPAPETMAVMRVMERVRPKLFYSLHNSGFGGVYFYASEHRPETFSRWTELVSRLGLPLHRGEPEVPYLEELAPCVYRMFGVADTYDYFARALDIDPAPLIGAGTSGDDWMRRVRSDAFSIVCEVPYFSVPGIGDDGASGISRRHAISTGLDHAGRALALVKRAASTLPLDLGALGRVGRSLLAYVEKTPDRLAAQREHLGAAEFDREATRAEAVDATWGPVFYHAMYLGEALRLAHEVGDEALAVDLSAELDRVDVQLRTEAGLERLPLQQLVRCQAGAALTALSA